MELYLNGETLYNVFLSGTLEVRKQKNALNKMNVFPVADGDTGSNLISTMNAIVEETVPAKSVKETLEAMANAALSGARGNSGIIFAQFLNGLNEETRNLHSFSIPGLAETIKRSVPYAYKAMMNPVEGTMITVIREWADEIYRIRNGVRNLEDMMVRGLEAARRSLAETPSHLDVLKRSAVVDSGASGFVYFLEGVVNFFRNKDQTVPMTGSEEIKLEKEEISFDTRPTFRYCTEALIEGKGLDQTKLLSELGSLGDSLIVAGTERKMRIHIHTDHPEDLFEQLHGKYTILQQKADDMLKQYQVVNERHRDTAILTDSIADLPEDWIEKHQIHVLPMNLTIDSSSYIDKVTLKADRFYSLLDQAREYPTSSQPTIKSIENQLSFLSSHYQNILAVLVSKEMSGTYQAVWNAAQKYKDQGYPIEVLNSKRNSGAEGLIVMEAAAAVEEMQSFEEIVDTVREQIDRSNILVSVDTFKYMVKGGRVSKRLGRIGSLFNLKPIVSIDEEGKGKAYGMTFSAKANRKKILAAIEKENQMHPIKSYCVVHADNNRLAEIFSQELESLLGKKAEYISQISPIVGLNAGKGAVAVAYKW